jgi:DNA-binding PadR family transcriptional regulator
MSAAWGPAGEFGPDLPGLARCLSGLLGHLGALATSRASGGATARATGRSGGRRGGSRDWGGWGPPGPGGRPGGKDWAGWWPGAPGPVRGPKAGRGDVRAAILALLREEPRNGYQIMSEIEERSGGAWRPSPGAVYPALSQLADEGLITGVESGGRRTFRLTEAGQRHIADNPERARPAWEAMAEGPPGEVRGLLVQAARLGGSVAQIAHAGTPEQIRAAGELLAATRRGIYQILAGDGDEDGGDAGDDDAGAGHAGDRNEGAGDAGDWDEDGGAGADLAGPQDEAEMDEGTGHG